MQQSDYILREIEKISAMIMGMIGKMIRKKNENIIMNDMAYHEIVNEFNSESLIKFDEILEMETDDFDLDFLRTNGYDNQNIERIALLFLTIGEISTEQRKCLLLKKALELYQHLDANQKTFSVERNTRMQYIKTLLDSSC